MASQDWLDKDFYAILGVPKDADAATIKKTYRKLARTLHPDQNANDPKAEERFKEIGEAYSVLSDEEQRRQYDQIRTMTRGGARFTSGPGGSSGGFDDLFSGLFNGGGGNVRFSTAGGAGQPDLQDLLGDLFAGGGRYGGQGGPGGFPPGFQAPAAKGADVQARTTLSFRDAVEGTTVTLRGADGQNITTRIPAGVRDGQRIRLRGKGSPGGPGAPRGDLILTVAVAPHPVFVREGDDLRVDLPVTFAEAALGATVRVPTLSGQSVSVKVPAGTPSGRQLRVKGRGVTHGEHAGDLLVRVQVVVPQRLTDEARAAIQALADQEQDVDPRAELMDKARS